MYDEASDIKNNTAPLYSVFSAIHPNIVLFEYFLIKFSLWYVLSITPPGDTIYAEYDDYLMPEFGSDGLKYDIGACRSSTNCDPSDHKTILATAIINHPDQWLR